MDSSLLGLMEFAIAAAFLIGWGVLEIVGLRLDKAREREKALEKEREAAKAARETPPS